MQLDGFDDTPVVDECEQLRFGRGRSDWRCRLRHRLPAILRFDGEHRRFQSGAGAFAVLADAFDFRRSERRIRVRVSRGARPIAPECEGAQHTEADGGSNEPARGFHAPRVSRLQAVEREHTAEPHQRYAPRTASETYGRSSSITRPSVMSGASSFGAAM
jgi:hypothetical protein